MTRGWLPGAVALAMCVATASCSSCRRTPQVRPEVYREAVVAFDTALAAIDTSQEVLARERLERLAVIVPEEPAAWANLGLLSLRQQDLPGARQHLARAAGLAPKAASIVRLEALAHSREGNLAESTRLWRRAVELDPDDPKAAYALAQDTERLGGPGQDAEAQRVLEGLLARNENLAVRLDMARLAAKRGDAASLARALAPLAEASAAWPAPARERLAALQAAAGRDPRAAATQVAFLRNVLAPLPAYRQAYARITTPLDALGEPIRQFLALPAPTAATAAPDTSLQFTVAPADTWPAAMTWVGTVALGSDGPETIVAGDAIGVFARPDAGIGTFAGRSSAGGPDPVIAADFDNDYRTDVALAADGGLVLLKQGEAGDFADVTAASGLPAPVLRGSALGGWPADIDLDGDLDAVLARDEPALVLRNNGDGTFTPQQPVACSALRGFAWADVDGEGVPDALCLDTKGAVKVLLNRRSGAFEDAAIPAAPSTLIAISAADVSGDGRMDLVGVTAAGEAWSLAFDDARQDDSRGAPAWRWRSLGRFAAASKDATTSTARLLIADLDNNGGVDLVASGPSNTAVLLASAPGTYAPLATPVPLRTFAVADLDEDGRLELVGLAGDGRPAVARSRGTKPYHWQRFRPRAATATGDQRVNSFGIGGELEVRTGLLAQTHRITAPVVHVGLGEATTSDVVRIVWPNGVLQSEFGLQADATIRTSQRLKGSCPWLFAWNGKEMAFVTDLIWRSPLGLRINAQVTADASTTEDWVKVGGDQLAARDGFYDLRVTAELWETHFFDLVSLAVVDHPAGTEVFVDERFAVPPPALAPVVTGPLQAFARVTDDTGRDASATAASRDDVHLDFAGRGRYQGVTRSHTVELTLPDAAPRTGPLYLVAQGWVHPTDSSINVALAQGRHAPPTGLSLAVADARGAFRTVKTNLGFPAGKDKTVLIDLQGLLPQAGERRLRLSTNLEVFWDRLAWAVGRPDVAVAPVRIAASTADLHYRGFSPTQQRSPGSPERPRYAIEGTAPRWLDLEGFHTRFGDIRPLLAAVDDRYLIMNAGDEIVLRFPEAPPAAPGMVRDFIVIGDGWVKDGDFNTTFSRTVLPLPTHATGRYDTPPRTLLDDPVYRQHADDYATYHTRYVTPAARRGLRPPAPR